MVFRFALRTVMGEQVLERGVHELQVRAVGPKAAPLQEGTVDKLPQKHTRPALRGSHAVHQRAPADVGGQGQGSDWVHQLKINIDLHFAPDQEVRDPEGPGHTTWSCKEFFFPSLQASGEAPREATGAG